MSKMPCPKCLDAFLELEQKHKQERKELENLKKKYQALQAEHARELDRLLDTLTIEGEFQTLSVSAKKRLRRLAQLWAQKTVEKKV